MFDCTESFMSLIEITKLSVLFSPGVSAVVVVSGLLHPGIILHLRVVHLDVEDTSEELLRQLPYAIKNQQGASKIPP